MQIGELAKQAGVSVRAIRYYEELGLIHPEKHSPGGFRLYGAESRKRLAVINFLKEAGLSLIEIRQILLAKKPTGGDKATVNFLLKAFGEKLAVVEAKIAALGAMRGQLAKTIGILRSCERCDHEILLDALACGGCVNLGPQDAVPETLEIILH
jgi:DNA-binding transcriptional MerR regulator